MNFLIGKGYWEFIIGDEEKPIVPKNPHNNKFKPIKFGMKKQRKFCIGFL
jgi:hypothetical protein